MPGQGVQWCGALVKATRSAGAALRTRSTGMGFSTRSTGIALRISSCGSRSRYRAALSATLEKIGPAMSPP